MLSLLITRSELRVMKFGGFAFLAAGLILAAHAYRPGPLDLSLITLPSLHSKADAASPAAKRTPPERMAFYPGPSLKALADLSDYGKPALAVAAVAAQQSAQAQPTLISHPAPVPRPVRRAVFLKAKAPPNRRALVRSIKRALRKAGCFDGVLNGKWNSTVKESLGTFMERANASLPYESPDYVHLTLVRSHANVSCAEQTCPAGQTAAADRCLPTTIMAKAPAKRPKTSGPDVGEFETTVTFANTIPPRRQLASASRTDRAAPLPGRMAVGAPGSEADDGEGDWWQVLFGGGEDSAEPVRSANATPQTLDRPAGLTHVPLRRVVRSGTLPQPRQKPIGQARLNEIATGRHNAPSSVPIETSALQLQDTTTVFSENQRRAERAQRKKAKARRAAKAKKRRRGQRRYSRRSRRSVQALFKHPLGRF